MSIRDRNVDAALIPEGECVYEMSRARIRKQAASFDIRLAWAAMVPYV